MTRKRKKIDGVLLLDKPASISSNQALQQARWLYQAEKAGHGGTLDPGDGTGTVIREAAPPLLDAVDWAALCARFSGVQRQVPPAFSALKVGGERAYALARRGELPQLEAREVVIHELRLLGVNGDSARFFVRCGKGTYIRSLLRDMAAALGSAGHTRALRRMEVAGLHSMTPLAMLRGWQEAGDVAALYPQRQRHRLRRPTRRGGAVRRRAVFRCRRGARRAAIPAAPVRAGAGIDLYIHVSRYCVCKRLLTGEDHAAFLPFFTGIVWGDGFRGGK